MAWKEFFATDAAEGGRPGRGRFPNAKGLLRGSVFVSHAGADAPTLNEMLDPVLYPRMGPAGVFMHSRSSGGADSYRQLVLVALSRCAAGVVAASVRSAGHPCVHAEVDWLLAHRRPLLVVVLDETPLSTVHWGLDCRDGKLSRVTLLDAATSTVEREGHLAAWLELVAPAGRSVRPV